MSLLIDNIYERGILIVEDDQSLGAAIQRFLIAKGYKKIFRATNGQEELAQLDVHEGVIYIVIVDLKMPVMGGFEMLQHATTTHKYPVGVIVTTGFGGEEAQETFEKVTSKEMVAMRMIDKPFTLDRLEGVIEVSLVQVHNKRLDHLIIPGEDFLDVFRSLRDNMVSKEMLAKTDNEIEKLSKRVPNFLQQLGYDVLKTLIIALLVIAVLKFGLSDLVNGVLPEN